MGRPAVKPQTDKRVYLHAIDPRTRKTKQITVYGMSPTEVLALVREAVARRAQEHDAGAPSAA